MTVHKFIAYALDDRTATADKPRAAMLALLEVIGLTPDYSSLDPWSTPDHYSITAVGAGVIGHVLPNPLAAALAAPAEPVAYDLELATSLIRDARRIGFAAAAAQGPRGGALALARMLADQLEAAGRLLVRGDAAANILAIDRLQGAYKSARGVKPRKRRR